MESKEEKDTNVIFTENNGLKYVYRVDSSGESKLHYIIDHLGNEHKFENGGKEEFLEKIIFSQANQINGLVSSIKHAGEEVGLDVKDNVTPPDAWDILLQLRQILKKENNNYEE